MSPSLFDRAVRRTPLRWWMRNRLTRMDVIQHCIDSLGASRYLEIGVSDGTCFQRINAGTKVGVDPIPAAPLVITELKRAGSSYFSLTSDEFFRTQAPRVLAPGVDVAFIDGLHTYGQTYRDCLNALDYLSATGVILVHDCLPASAAEAVVADNFDEAIRLNRTGPDSFWVGDTWKAIVALRTKRPDLEAAVLDCDHGIGVIVRGRNTSGLSLTAEEIEAMSYPQLARDAGRLLGLRRPRHLFSMLDRRR